MWVFYFKSSLCVCVIAIFGIDRHLININLLTYVLLPTVVKLKKLKMDMILHSFIHFLKCTSTTTSKTVDYDYKLL